jgi:histone arginine demethylase JMJD6
MIIGPANSGSNIHIDPLCTSAWNLLLIGRKLWVLFPPDVLEKDIKSRESRGECGECREEKGEGKGEGEGKGQGEGKGRQGQGEGEGEGKGRQGQREGEGGDKERDFCAAGWFSHLLPNLPPEVYNTRTQFVQHAGEAVFVPEGWWHAVLNLDTTLAVTQNFAHPHSFERVSAALTEADSSAARKWRRNIAKRQL